MTRTIIDGSSQTTINTAAINLTHLLDRLENNLGSFADIKPLLRSEYHRARVGANIEYARTLLLELERACGAGGSPTSSATSGGAGANITLHPDLASQRQKIKELKGRFEDIEERAVADEEMLDADSDEEEVLVPTPEESDEDDVDSERRDKEDGVEDEDRERDGQHENADTEAETGLRSRRSPIATETSTATATTTGTSHATASSTTAASTPSQPLHTAKAELFHRSRPQSPSSSSPDAGETVDTETEANLSHDRAEQETLTTSLLQLASQLKESTRNFATSLEGEKGILSRAVEGLDRNIAGMEKVGGRMGTVRRMAEGKGWWDRMMMYAVIFGLWVVAILLVFVAPKLRF